MSGNDDVHPTAPAGGGGLGAFRSARTLGTDPRMERWMEPGPAGSQRQLQASRIPAVPEATAHHDVQRGESLWSIAAQKLGNGLLADDLARLNRIAPEAVLHIGQRLIVPDYQRCDLTVRYMLGEMTTNAGSAEVRSIQQAVARSKNFKQGSDEALDDLKKARWYELFRVRGDQAVFNAMVQQSGVAMAEAQARWFLQVRQDGPWDHKPILRKMYEAMPSPPRPFGSLGKWLHFPIRGDIVHEYYYDVWSNVHYGYVGAKCGFDDATLQGGAASGLPGAGDNDEGDVISVQIGIDLWRRAGAGLDAPTLLRAITASAGAYLAARSGEISRGASAAHATNVVITDNDYK